MANEETVKDRFLKELYGLTDGHATRVVRGEELARRLGMDPKEETDKARFHDLPHTYLSLLAQRGEPIRDLQALAGHATASFTLQRYTYHYNASARRTANTMGDILPDER
jgi:integrase